jgi:hypothetical protein
LAEQVPEPLPPEVERRLQRAAPEATDEELERLAQAYRRIRLLCDSLDAVPEA